MSKTPPRHQNKTTTKTQPQKHHHATTKASAVGKGAGQSPALVRWYAAFPAWRWYAGTLVRCFPRLALVRWYAATLNGRRGAGTLNCAGTLPRWMAGPTLVRWYAAFKGGIWNLHAFSREIGFQALIVKIIQPAAKAPASLGQAYITALDMCKVCTEAVHCVALWTRVTLL